MWATEAKKPLEIHYKLFLFQIFCYILFIPETGMIFDQLLCTLLGAKYCCYSDGFLSHPDSS